MGKIVFKCSSDGSVSVKDGELLKSSLTPKVYFDWFADTVKDSVTGKIYYIWTSEFEVAARVNYIVYDGGIHECVLYRASDEGLQMKVKTHEAGFDFLDDIYPEDGDEMFTTYDDAVEKLNAECGEKMDDGKACVLDNGASAMTVEEQIKALVSEKMSYMAKIKAINNKIKALQETL